MTKNYKPCTHKILPVSFEDEVYVNVTQEMIPGVLPYYQVSNYGNVYSKNSGYLLSPGDSSSGYLNVVLQTETGKVNVVVHRLVMMAFDPIDNPDEMEVNHDNGNKKCNKRSNLEWVTPPENVQHAFRTGLTNNICENSVLARLKNDQVEIICQGLQDGISFEEICEKIGEPCTYNMKGIIRSILEYRAWREISKNYTFQHYEPRKSGKRFTDDQVRTICALFQEGTTLDSVGILEYLGFDMKSMDEHTFHRYRDAIYLIKCRRNYTSISKDYIF